MKSYYEKGIFRNYWGWFETPHDMAGVASANFFSYLASPAPRFHREDILTSVIDLTPDLDTLWGKTRAGFVRKQIEQGARRGVVVRRGGDFDLFYRFYREFLHESRKGIGRIARASLKEEGILFTAYMGELLVAGGVFIGDGTTLRAWVLASRRAEAGGRMRDVIGSSNRAIVWEAIRWAKENGYRSFDLGGIAPDDRDPHLRNIAAFKEAFGGERRMSYHYTKVYSPLMRLWLFVRDRLLS